MSRKQGKRNQRKVEKKRKDERAKRLTRMKSQPLAYHGQKYHTPELADVYLHAELGIFEAHALTGRKLTDAMVVSALGSLIQQIRQGLPLSVPPQGDIEHTIGEEESWIEYSVRRNLARLGNRLPDRDTVVGVLRSILGSIEIRRIAGAQSRGYLQFLEGFLTDLGVVMEVERGDAQELDDEADEERLRLEADASIEDEEDEGDVAAYATEEPGHAAEELADRGDLLNVGRIWHRTADPDIETVFRALADEMIASGEAGRVAEICRTLAGEGFRPSIVADFTAIALRAERVQQAASQRAER